MMLTMRTIDADKLVDMLYDNEFAALCPLDEVSGVIDACPTVDAVPVVRCKDCKDWGPGLGGIPICRKTNKPMSPNGFCSYGKYQTNGGIADG